MSRLKGAAAEDEKLVELIRRHPAIYDAALKEYKDTQAKDTAWRAVADGAGRNPEECKKRWRDIRDHYFKIKRKMKIGSATSYRPPKWNLFEYLTFLDGLKRDRRSHCPKRHVDPVDEDEQTDALEDYCTEEAEVMEHIHSPRAPGNEETPAALRSRACAQQPTDPRPSRKTRLGNRKPLPHSTIISEYEKGSGDRMKLVRTIATEDDVDAFFRSIALTVKKFPPSLIGTAKLKVLTAINELEQSFQYPSRSSSPS